MKGQDHEVAFWRNFLERRGREYEKARPLSSLFNFMIDGKDRVRIANLGAGAVSLIGEVWEGTEVEVVASDILANEYAAIRSELGINLYTPVEYEDMTDLLWKDNAFDIVFCANALDHCQPHPGAFIYALSGEVRIVNTLQNRPVHAMARIAHGKSQIWS